MNDIEFNQGLTALSSTSDEAAALAQSIVNDSDIVMVSVPKSYILELQTTIQQLKDRITLLSIGNGDKDDIDLTDSEVKQLYDCAYADIKAQPYAILFNNYTVRGMQQYSIPVQKIIASALVNVCTERNITPRPFWLSASLGVSND